jgi:hypothetical protein
MLPLAYLGGHLRPTDAACFAAAIAASDYIAVRDKIIALQQRSEITRFLTSAAVATR